MRKILELLAILLWVPFVFGQGALTPNIGLDLNNPGSATNMLKIDRYLGPCTAASGCQGSIAGQIISPSLSCSPNTQGTFNVFCYGAKGDGNTNDAPAINATRAACEAGGGGTIVFPLTAAGYVIKAQQPPYGNDVPSLLLKQIKGGPSCSWNFGGNNILLRADAAFAGTLPYPPGAYVDSPYDQEPVVAPFIQGTQTFTLASTVGWKVGDRVWWGYGVIPQQTPLGLEPYYFGYADITAISGNNVTIDQPSPTVPNSAFVANGLYKVTMTSTGSGYSGGDTCSFSDPTGSGALCVLVVSGGQATAYVGCPAGNAGCIASGQASGNGYTSPTLNISTSTGSGAAATIVIASGYIVSGLNGTWRTSQNATITNVQGYVYQNARIENGNFVTDITHGGDAEEGILCTFCDNVQFINFSCTNAAGAGCVYPHYSANLTAIGTKIYSSQEQDGNRAKGRCMGISKAHNTQFLNTDCNNFDTGALIIEDPNTNVYLNNFFINDTSPNHCHGNSCPNGYIGASGRLTIDNLTIAGNGNVPVFGDPTGTNVVEFRNVTLNTLAPVIIYAPILQHMTGFLNIENDPGTVTGNLTGFYPPPKTFKSSCTAAAGSTTNCGPLPSGIYRSLSVLGDENSLSASFVRLFSGWTNANLATPTAPSGTQSTGGSLTAGTVCAVVVQLDQFTNPTAPSPETCVAVDGTTQTAISWTWTALSQATGARLYVGATGAESSYFLVTGNSYTQTTGTGTAGTPSAAPTAGGFNYAPLLTPGSVVTSGLGTASSSIDTDFYTPSTNYKNQGRNRFFQVVNTSGTAATTVNYTIEYWPEPVSDGTDFGILGDAANLGLSNTYSPGNKQIFSGGQNTAGNYVAPVNIGPMASDPTAGAIAGDTWFNSTSKLLKIYDGSQGQIVAFASNLPLLGTSASWNNSGSAIAANTCINGPTATVTGLTNGFGLSVSPNALLALGLTQYAYLSTTNTAQIVVCNVTASPITIGTAHAFTVIATPAPL